MRQNMYFGCMNQPPFLQHGDKIAFAATARKVSPAEMQPAVDVFTSWGLQVVTHEQLYMGQNQLAGTDEHRAAYFQQLLNDHSIRAIIIARGGYGSVRMVDRINWAGFAENPKWLIGYSDVTVLHGQIHQLTGIPTIHATMPINFPGQLNEGEAISTLKTLLFGGKSGYTIKSHPFNKNGKAKGVMIGGNLSVLYSMIGSVSFPDMDGKILFLEDLDEYLYHIDRMMMGLKRAGVLSNLAGLVVGAMSDMRDNTIPFGKTAEEIIADLVSEYNYPVCYGFPAGHITDNRALKFGVNYTMEVGEKVYIKEQ